MSADHERAGTERELLAELYRDHQEPNALARAASIALLVGCPIVGFLLGAAVEGWVS